MHVLFKGGRVQRTQVAVMVGCAAMILFVGTAVQADEFTFDLTTPGSHASWIKAVGGEDLGGQISGMAFDTQNPDRLYFLRDQNGFGTSEDDGLYSVSYTTEVVSPRLATVVRHSDMTVDAAGTVYAVCDYASALTKIENPMGAPVVTTILGTYSGESDDDGIALDLVPPGFTGGGVVPGDLVIGDRGIDNNSLDGLIGVSLPGATPNTLYAETTDLSVIGSLDAMASSAVDGKIYFADANAANGGTNHIFRLSDSLVLETLVLNMPGGEELTNIDAMAVNPVDGSIWLADDTLDQIWRVDYITGDATLEIQMVGDGDTIPGVNFGENALAFSANGRLLAVGDAQFEEIHYFAVPEPATLGLIVFGAAALLRRRR